MWKFLSRLGLSLSLAARAVQAEPADPAVAEADAQLNRLIMAGDAQAIEPFYATEFVLTASDGSRKDRARMLSEVASPALHFSRNQTEQVQVRVLGNTAVLTGVLHQTGSWQGKPFDYRFLVTDTWVRQGDRWVLLAGHASLIPS